MKFEQGRTGPRTVEQRRREILRGATRKATERYSMGGNLKKGDAAPKPVTLPTFNFREEGGS